MPDAVDSLLSRVDSGELTVPGQVRPPLAPTDEPVAEPTPVTLDPNAPKVGVDGLTDYIRKPVDPNEDLFSNALANGALAESSVDPVRNALIKTAPARARKMIAEYAQGEHPELTEDDLIKLDRVASDGTTAGQRLWTMLSAPFVDHEKTAKAIWNPDAEARGEQPGIVQRIGSGIKGFADEYYDNIVTKTAGQPWYKRPWSMLDNSEQMGKNLMAGGTKGVLGLIPVVTGLGAGAENVVTDSLGFDAAHGVNATQYQFEHHLSRAEKATEEAIGADPESYSYAAGENVAPLLVPLGGEAGAAETVAKAADKVVEAGTRGAAKIAKAGIDVAEHPVTHAVALTAAGHPLAGVAALGGESIAKRFLPRWMKALGVQLPESPLKDVRDILSKVASAPEGETVMETAQKSVATKLENLQAAAEDIAADSDVTMAQKMTPDGKEFLHPADALPDKASKTYRTYQEQMRDLLEKQRTIEKYAQINQILSDGGKLMLSSGGNTLVGGLIGEAFADSTAPPLDTDRSIQGFGMGAALAAPLSGVAGIHGTRQMRANALAKLGEDALPETHPDFARHEAAMEGAHDDVAKTINMYAGLLKPHDVNVVALSDADMAAKTSTQAGTKQTPSGVYDPSDPSGKTVFLNIDKMNQNPAGHEAGHAILGEAVNAVNGELFQKITDAINNPDSKVSGPFKEFAQFYGNARRRMYPNDPGLTTDKIRDEALAELAGHIFQQYGPAAFYGGESGGQIIERGIKSATNSLLNFLVSGRRERPEILPGFNTPVVPGTRDALTDILFKTGKAAEQGEKIKDGSQPPPASATQSTGSQPPATPAPVTPTAPAPAPAPAQAAPTGIATVTAPPDAVDALKAMGWKQSVAKQMADAAANDLGQGAKTADIVALAMKKKSQPVPITEQQIAVPAPNMKKADLSGLTTPKAAEPNIRVAPEQLEVFKANPDVEPLAKPDGETLESTIKSAVVDPNTETGDYRVYADRKLDKDGNVTRGTQRVFTTRLLNETGKQTPVEALVRDHLTPEQGENALLIQQAIESGEPIRVNHNSVETDEFRATGKERTAELSDEERDRVPVEKNLQPVSFYISGDNVLVNARSIDKVLANVKHVQDWLGANRDRPEVMALWKEMPYKTLQDLREDLPKYYENQAHGYGGGGQELKGMPAADPNFKPHPLSDDKVQFLNLIQGESGRNYADIAEQNRPQPYQGRESSINPLRDKLDSLGFSVRDSSGAKEVLHSATETLRLDRINGVTGTGEVGLPRGKSSIQKAGFKPDVEDFSGVPRGNVPQEHGEEIPPKRVPGLLGQSEAGATDLSSLSREIPTPMEGDARANARAASEGERSQLRESVSAQRQDQEATLSSLREPTEPNAPRRLQQAATGNVAVPEAPSGVTPSDLSRLTKEPEKFGGNPAPNEDDPPWVHRYFELDAKEKTPEGLTAAEEKELYGPVWDQMLKEYGSNDAFYLAHGGKQYNARNLFADAGPPITLTDTLAHLTKRNAPDETPRIPDRGPDLKFRPDDRDEAIKEAAIRYSDGTVYTGMMHMEALTKALDDKRDIAGHDAPESGYVTNDGQFLSREDAMDRAKKIGQLTERGYSKAQDYYGYGSDSLGERNRNNKSLESLSFQRARKFKPDVSPEEILSSLPLFPAHQSMDGVHTVYSTHREPESTTFHPEQWYKDFYAAAESAGKSEGLPPPEPVTVPHNRPEGVAGPDTAHFPKTENPLILVGHDYGPRDYQNLEGGLWWDQDEGVAMAKKAGHDAVIALSPDAIPRDIFRQVIQEVKPKDAPWNWQPPSDAFHDAVTKNLDKIDWEHANNEFIPLGSEITDKPGVNPDRVLDRYNKGEIDSDRVKRLLSTSFKPDIQTDTPEFKRWFGESKVVDDDGAPMPLYHGTTHDFTVFDPGKGNVESDWGKGIYLSNEPADTAKNYAGHGPDLTNRIEQQVEQLNSQLPHMDVDEMMDEFGLSREEAEYLHENTDFDKTREIAKRILAGPHGGATMKVFVKMENPIEIGGDREGYWDVDFGDPESEDFGSDPKGKLYEFMDSLDRVANSYYDVDMDKVREDLSNFMDGAKPSEVINAARKSEGLSYATDENGNLVAHEIVRAALQDMGYDGIIDRTVHSKFGRRAHGRGFDGKEIIGGMEGMNPDTVHYIAFDPKQIKSATGNTGAFNPSNPDIRFKPDVRIPSKTANDIMTGDYVPTDEDIHPTGPHGRRTLRDVAKFLTRRALADGGSLAEYTPENLHKHSNVMADEIVNALSRDGNALGWYDRQFKSALGTLSQIYPEIGSGSPRDSVFKAILAITSNGQDVRSNFNRAVKLFGEYRDTGKIDTSIWGGKTGPAISGALTALQKLIDNLNEDGTQKFLESPLTVKALKRLGYGVTGELADTELKGAYIFGPKLGSFFSNLNGDYSPTTMDRWFMRTFNRQRGTLTSVRSDALEGQLDRFLSAVAGKRTYQDLDVGPARDQAREILKQLRKDTFDPDKFQDEKGPLQQFVRRAYQIYARDGYKDRSEINTSSKNLDENVRALREAPLNGTDRNWVRQVMAEARKKLQEQGIEINSADAQALMWYYEKDLYGKLYKQIRRAASADYATAASELLDAIRAGREIDDRSIEADSTADTE